MLQTNLKIIIIVFLSKILYFTGLLVIECLK